MTERDHELSVLAYLVQHPDTYYTYGDRLKDFHFGYSPAKAIYVLLARVVKKFDRMPTRAELAHLCKTRLAGKTSVAVVAKILQDVESIYTMDVSEVTGEVIAHFATRRELTNLAQQIMAESDPERLLENLPSFQQSLDSVHMLSARDTNLGIFPFSEAALKNPLGYVAELYGGDPLPLGYPRLDKKLLGGLRNSELGIILAATGVGKTLFLLHVALGAALRRKNVIYYAYDNSQAEMLERSYSNVSGVPISDEKEENVYRDAIVKGLRGVHNEHFLLVPQPAHSMSVKDIYRHAKKAKKHFERVDLAEGIDPAEAGKIHLIVVDYGDLLIPTAKYREYHLVLGEVFNQISGVAQRLNVPILTATQGNRESLSAETVTMGNLANSYMKAWTASFIAALCQTDDEYQAGAMRLAVVKVRRPENHYIVPLRVCYQNMRIYEDPNAELTRIAGKGITKPINDNSPVPTNGKRRRKTTAEEDPAFDDLSLSLTSKHIG